MKTIKTVLGAMFWPIAVLLPGYVMKISERVLMFMWAVGIWIGLVGLTVNATFFFSVKAWLYSDLVITGVLMGTFICFYVWGYRFLIFHFQKKQKPIDPNQEMFDPLKRMKEHGSKSRVAWEQAERGPCNPLRCRKEQ